VVKLTRLRAVRERKALTQDELAELAGVSRQTVVKIEGGLEPRPPTIRKLAKALGVEPSGLMEIRMDSRRVSRELGEPLAELRALLIQAQGVPAAETVRTLGNAEQICVRIEQQLEFELATEAFSSFNSNDVDTFKRIAQDIRKAAIQPDAAVLSGLVDRLRQFWR